MISKLSSNILRIASAIGGAEMEVQLIERLKIFRWYEFLAMPRINSCLSFSKDKGGKGEEKEKDRREEIETREEERLLHSTDALVASDCALQDVDV